MNEEIHNVKAKTEQEETTVKKDIDYDTLLSSAGELGRYQILLMLSTFPFYFFGVNVYFSQLFMTEVPQQHWCWIPELINLTQNERRNLAAPKDQSDRFGYAHCEAYNANWTEVLANGSLPNATTTEPCKNGWEFDRTDIPYPTISSDFEWVCDKKSYQATAQAIFFSGSVVGGILIGWMADKYGRVPATILSNLLGFVGGISSTFVMNFTEFAICRFIMGMAYDSCMLIPYLIVLEYTAPKYRSILANSSFGIFFSLFATSYPFLALACGHWKTLSLVSSLPLALAVLAPLFLPESPMWLLSEGRIEEVISKIQVIARINRKQIPPTLIEQFKQTIQKEDKENQLGFYEVFKRPLLRRNMLLICLVYMTSLIVFDGLFRNLDQLQFDFFYSFAASSATELPSVLLCAFIMDILGRRWLAVIVLTINSVASVLTMFVKSGVSSVVCAVIARFVINMALNTSLQWSAELLPTPVRGSGVSYIIICGNIGIILSPYITYLKVYRVWLPYVIFGCLAIIGAVISSALPETAGKELPQTFDDAETLARTKHFWQMPCCRAKENKSKSQGEMNRGLELSDSGDNV